MSVDITKHSIITKDKRFANIHFITLTMVKKTLNYFH